MENVYIKLDEYKSLLDFKDEYRGKDCKNNFKFIKQSINKMVKHKETELDITNFLEDTIDVCKKAYNKYLNQP